MKNQMELFSGAALRDQGIRAAMDHADRQQEKPKWSEQAYQFLKRYISTRKGQFMVEEVRELSQGHIPAPPSNRAWGGVVQRLAREGKIQRAGYMPVANPKAHCAPCSVWQIVK